jgi:hypothetical protein
MYTIDDGCTPTPAPSLIHTQKSADRSYVPSMPNIALPSCHSNTRHHERLHLEVKRYPFGHCRADITNALQERPSLRDSSPAHAYRADSRAGCFNVGRIQPGSVSPSCASGYGSLMDPSKGNFLHHWTFPEEHFKYSASPAEAEPEEATSKANPSGIMPRLSAQVTVTHFDPGHPMTPHGCYSESLNLGLQLRFH